MHTPPQSTKILTSILMLIFIAATFSDVLYAYAAPTDTSTSGTTATTTDTASDRSTNATERRTALRPNIESSTTPEVIRGRAPTDLTPSVESGTHREVERKIEVRWEGKETLLDALEASRSEEAAPLESSVSLQSFSASAAPGLGPNLVPNFDLENTTASGLPLSWFKGGYGTNSRTLNYPAAGADGSKAIEVRVSTYTSGDAKWYSAEIPVTPGKTYRLANSVRSTIPSYITLRYKKTDGSFLYSDILTTGAHSNFTEVETQFTIPSNVESLSIFHLIKAVGTLATDNYYLQEIIPPTGGNTNLMPNSGFEVTGTNGLPASWFKGGYGTNSRVLTYPVAGAGGSKAVEVRITSYTSGDAKWYHEPVPVSTGIYTFTNAYTSNIPSTLTAQFEKNDGTFSYLDLANLPASPNGFSPAVVDFSVPNGVTSVRIFHLIKQVGTLTIDDAALYKKTGSGGVFDVGAVSFSFDDGWRAHHDIAMQELNDADLKGTFYVISKQLTENGFIGFMTHDQVRAIHASGHEIGSHTQTHKPLTTLSSTAQKTEIENSKTDLEDMGVGPITTFSYPFGDYNASVLSLVKNAPYDAARSTINGNVVPSSDLYQLPRFSVESNTTLANIKSAVDTAIASKQWIILVFHRIDESGERYSTTPDTFRQIVEYVDSKNVYVPTVAEGINNL